jgi:GT2 family glycosyltransferase
VISIVITDFNGWAQTRVCLERLFSGGGGFDVFLVDHGTSNECSRGVAAQFPAVKVVKASPDLWWTGATNVGLREALAAGAEAVMLLNNDCYLGAEDFRRLAAHSASVGGAGIVAPLQRDSRSGTLLENFFSSSFLLGFPSLKRPWPRDSAPGDARLVQVDLIIGGRGVVLPRAVLDRVGLMAEKELPHYWADHDFYLRCRRAGVPLYLALDAFVDVDDTRTTQARGLGRLSLRQFAGTLSDRRSHRNILDLAALFRRHYPVPGLYWIGVALNVARYSLTYALARLGALARAP